MSSDEGSNAAGTSGDCLPDPEQLARTNEAYYAILSQYCSPSSPRKRSHSPDSNEEVTSKKVCRESQTHILSLPPELLEAIVSCLTYAEQSRIRLTCHLFKNACETVLNKAFTKIQSQVHGHFQRIKAKMPRRESARRRHPLARECDIIETLHMRLTLLQMTFGKHIERLHCCFFAGEILDEVVRIMAYVKATPNLGRAYKVTDELFDLSTMAMEYFKEKVEPKLPEISYFSTDFSEFTPAISSPGPRTLVLSLDSPTPNTGNKGRAYMRKWTDSSYESPASTSTSIEPRPSPTSTQSTPSRTPKSCPRQTPLVRTLRRTVKKNYHMIQSLRRELRETKRKVVAQHKRLVKANMRWEQHERSHEDNDRKIEALMREVQQCRTELQVFRAQVPAKHSALPDSMS